jgi:FPC/CPF motif-containing protein YcgG
MSSLTKIQEAAAVDQAIRELVLQKDYPCVAAIQSVHRAESRFGVYSDFGTGRCGERLRQALQEFVEEQTRSRSEYLSYWAIFDGRTDFSETEFERGLWRELSSLTSEQQKAGDWGEHNSDVNSEKFEFCLFGEPFFVVGLHPASSRKARRFQRPALVFNVFSQFQSLQKKGVYERMVQSNRLRDRRFQGNANPMAERHGEKWEAIQFSGKSNGDQWKCPFHFLQKN